MNGSATKILSVSSGRADAGILAPIWEAISRSGGSELKVFLTGMHLKDDAFARQLLPPGTAIALGGADLGGGSANDAALAMGEILRAMAETCEDYQPDVVLFIGDRLDMVPAALATVPFNLPLAHLHGGELSLGAVDDRLRHGMAKLAHLHCTASVEAAARLCRMGEEPWRIHVTGAPGLDSALAVPEMDRATLANRLGMAELDGMRLVTIHPETNAADPIAAADAVLSALDSLPGPTLFTAPNSDPGGELVARRIADFVSDRSWAVLHDTLGTELYVNAMRSAAVMLGNSSSGLIEAPFFGLPVINVGRRQDGRLRADNVHDCPADADSVTGLLAKLTTAAKSCRRAGKSPYGDGRAARRIAALLSDLPPREKLLYKRFAEEEAQFSAPWANGGS